MGQLRFWYCAGGNLGRDATSAPAPVDQPRHVPDSRFSGPRVDREQVPAAGTVFGDPMRPLTAVHAPRSSGRLWFDRNRGHPPAIH